MSQVDVASAGRNSNDDASKSQESLTRAALFAMAGRFRQPVRRRLLCAIAGQAKSSEQLPKDSDAHRISSSADVAASLGSMVDRALTGETDPSPVRTDAIHTLSARGGDAPVDAPAEGSYAR